MTALTPPSAAAPFLLWPVTRREFYRTIIIALLPTLAWATIIFGWRVPGMLIGASLATWIAHALLKRFTARGKQLVFPHSLVAAWVLVALAQPYWPIWIVSLTALFIPLALWLVGGPGREPIHIAVLALLVLQFIFIPFLHADAPDNNTGAILARDRLVMGDIRDHIPIPLYQWPNSAEIRGNDAAALPRPGFIATRTLDELSQLLAPKNLWSQTAPRGGGNLNPDAQQEAVKTLDRNLGLLPSMELFLLGVSPGRVGTVSLIGLVFAGLFLAYRYILRPRSVAFFFISYILASTLLALWPAFVTHGAAHLSPAAVWRIWSAFPAEVITLLCYTILNSDAPFAAIIILALPGSEPLTPRGRQIFLIAAALLAALLTRTNLPIPAATLAISILMPLAPRFDHYFAKRSWLNRLL